MPIHPFLIGILIFIYAPTADSITCFQCTDCPEPFIETYPYVTLANNTNFLAKCTKTIMKMADGRRLVSKGTVFFCPTQAAAADAEIYCCNTDFCNGSSHINLSITIMFLFLFILIKP
ncbi:unnamed protein product [Adineta ricciae]|uniref:Uncharacterized protein n=1 Tax=Adineta ricciae TaxID=249248 RepID=A0A813PT52_ADIRI|nr:unnamed protein product [Adineta ricciae]CAF0757933.1 unnamed protein product [Adineta ricciae]